MTTIIFMPQTLAVMAQLGEDIDEIIAAGIIVQIKDFWYLKITTHEEAS